MARNQISWLNAFYKFWGYVPERKIRKSSGYIGDITLHDAITYFSENKIPCDVKIIFPFAISIFGRKKKHDCLIVFPQIIRLKLPTEKEYTTWKLYEPILFNGRRYTLKEFAEKSPKYNSYYEPGAFNTFSLPLNYFLITTDELRGFKKRYLDHVSKIIVDAHDLEGRGKKNLNKIEKERKAFVIREYKRLGKPKRFPIGEIQERLENHITSKYGADLEKGSQLRCTDMTIYRILKTHRKG